MRIYVPMLSDESNIEGLLVYSDAWRIKVTPFKVAISPGHEPWKSGNYLSSGLVKSETKTWGHSCTDTSVNGSIKGVSLSLQIGPIKRQRSWRRRWKSDKEEDGKDGKRRMGRNSGSSSRSNQSTGWMQGGSNLGLNETLSRVAADLLAASKYLVSSLPSSISSISSRSSVDNRPAIRPVLILWLHKNSNWFIGSFAIILSRKLLSI